MQSLVDDPVHSVSLAAAASHCAISTVSDWRGRAGPGWWRKESFASVCRVCAHVLFFCRIARSAPASSAQYVRPPPLAEAVLWCPPPPTHTSPHTPLRTHKTQPPLAVPRRRASSGPRSGTPLLRSPSVPGCAPTRQPPVRRGHLPSIQGAATALGSPQWQLARCGCRRRPCPRSRLWKPVPERPPRCRWGV